MKPDDICPRPQAQSVGSTEPLAEPIYLSSVYRCHDPAEADAILSGQQAGYLYQRDGHPNARALAEKCRLLHAAQEAAICASGMSALAAIVLSQLRTGDHIIVAEQLYGRSQRLLTEEVSRLGISVTRVDTCQAHAVAAAVTAPTRLIIAETIANPTLRVIDIAALADVAHRAGALLAIDNTFASPVVCRPLAWGADLVFESLTKIMNGHSDVLLGLVCGNSHCWGRVGEVLASWGLVGAAFDCWLASRGIGTLALRVGRANDNALAVAARLVDAPQVEQVFYPGLKSHPDHELARRQFEGRFGAMVTFNLRGGRDAATRFIRAARQIPFSPSLGELCTTLSHPQSTSHRGLSEAERQALGISGGTIRLSVGIESPQFILAGLDEGLAAV